MTCFFAIFTEGNLKKYSCSWLRENKDILKKEFRENNLTDRILALGRRDRAYEEYCMEIEESLDQCKCEQEIPLYCAKCPKEDHENEYFCRCEARNIKLAKQFRKLGHHPRQWKKTEHA